jgi:hypothetical protein
MEAEALAVGQQWAGFIEGQNKKNGNGRGEPEF